MYVPQADLRRFGVTGDGLRAGRYGDAFVALMAHEAGRARAFYADARAAFPSVDARALVPAEIIRSDLRAPGGDRGAPVPRLRRARRARRRKAAIALRCWAGAMAG